jgi:hypothetical protein
VKKFVCGPLVSSEVCDPSPGDVEPFPSLDASDACAIHVAGTEIHSFES